MNKKIQLVIIIFLVTLFYIILKVQFSLSFIVMFNPLVLLFMLVFFSILKGHFKKDFKISILLLSLIFGIMVSSTINNEKKTETQQNAAQLIKALEEYKNINSRYPENLTDLTPKYITEIPKTYMKFFNHPGYYYWLGDNKAVFTLGFNLDGWYGYRYYSDKKKWTFYD